MINSLFLPLEDEFRREISALPRADFVYPYPRSRLAQDAKQGGIEFAEDFKRGMDEMGINEYSSM